MLSKQVFRSYVGIGSNSHDFDGAFWVILRFSSIEAGEKLMSGTPSNLISALSIPITVFHVTRCT